ncbi:protocadherin-9 [Elysia marginata]|uniref:Protocadherin-9 n=1 Tax=Elysia marginata TaxID=1093978 RepID=A0AAV4H0W4_9GAST|nr:protocadherin-9 [Elysia marginata]
MAARMNLSEAFLSRQKTLASSAITSVRCLVLTLLLPHLVFSQNFSFSIREQQPAGLLVGNIGQQLNHDTNGCHAHFIILGGQHSEYFRVDEVTGNLFTNGVLDRELLCPMENTCDLQLQVTIISGFATHILAVTVQLQDINDNSPVFGQAEMTLRILETAPIGEMYVLPRAVDLDTGAGNSVQAYTLSSTFGNEFQLHVNLAVDGTQGLYLVVNSLLDRERIDRYHLILTARDGGNDPSPREGNMTIVVLVDDVNDNQPIFERANYSAQLSDNTTAGQLVMTLRAVDVDSGSNAVVHFRLSSNQENANVTQQFQIDRYTGDLMTLGSLPSGQYRVNVEAVDGGMPSLVGHAVVIVDVVSSGNTRPTMTVTTFNSDHPWAVVSEFAMIGAVVAHVAVSDPDPGVDGLVMCSISGSTFGLRALGNEAYVVTLNTNLDREVQAQYTLTLTCRDNGAPPLSITQDLEVRVQDENDNRPTLTTASNTTVSVYENNNINEVVTHIEATDADVGDNAALTFSILGGPHHTFHIPQGTNVLRLSRVLDREVADTYMVTVLVRDHGHPPMSATATLRINVLDVNDNAPQFAQGSYNLSISENNPIGTYIGRMTAFDDDAGDNSHIDYSILHQPGEPQKFRIQANGFLTAVSSLDHESVSVYNIMIQATDRGTPPLTSQVPVEIRVIDVNDNRPVFMWASSSVTLVLPVPSFQSVFVIQAVDADSGSNGNIQYSLWPQTSSMFQLDPYSGLLFTSRALTTHDVGSHNLTVTATDGGMPPLRTTEILTVVVNADDTL